MIFQLTVIIAIIASIFSLVGSDDVQTSCSSFSSKDSDDFWASVSRCPQCIQEVGCGFCQSTLQCLAGTSDGPLSSHSCPSWTFGNDSCPGKFY